MEPREPLTTSPVADALERRATDHFVQFYEHEAGLVDAITHFVGTGLDDGGAAIVITLPRHLKSVSDRLAGRGLDVEGLERSGRYVGWDSAQTLSRITVDGWPDTNRFGDVIERAVARASVEHGGQGVRVYGDMVTLLWNDGRREAALQLEKLWTDLRRRHAFSLFCAYPMSSFDVDRDGKQLLQICAEHGHVIPAESFGGMATAEDRLRVILQLQQKSRALDDEATRRRELEDRLRRQEKELADVFDNVLDCVVDVLPDGRVSWANRAFLRMLGFVSLEEAGLHLEPSLLSRDVLDETWSRLVSGQPVREVLVGFRGQEGMPRHALLHAGGLRKVGRGVQMRWFLRAETEA